MMSGRQERGSLSWFLFFSLAHMEENKNVWKRARDAA